MKVDNQTVKTGKAAAAAKTAATEASAAASAATLPGLVITSIIRKNNPSKWNFPFHVHEDFTELIYITHGSGHFAIRNRDTAVRAGMLVLIPPGVYHYFFCQPGENMEYNSICFMDTPEAKAFLPTLQGHGVCCTEVSGRMEQLEQMFDLLFELYQNGDSGKGAESAFYSLTLSLVLLAKTAFLNDLQMIEEGEPDSEQDRLFYEILLYITENFNQKITLSSLARKYSLSCSNLSHLFARIYGRSPIDYLIQSRVAYSTRFLIRTNKPIEEIASLVGYTTTAHFIRQFTERIGQTPTEYRMANRNNMIDRYEDALFISILHKPVDMS